MKQDADESTKALPRCRLTNPKGSEAGGCECRTPLDCKLGEAVRTAYRAQWAETQRSTRKKDRIKATLLVAAAFAVFSIPFVADLYPSIGQMLHGGLTGGVAYLLISRAGRAFARSRQ